jgi:hypothetical protein
MLNISETDAARCDALLAFGDGLTDRVKAALDRCDYTAADKLVARAERLVKRVQDRIEAADGATA